jgi:hypothetical protein
MDMIAMLEIGEIGEFEEGEETRCLFRQENIVVVVTAS